MDPQPTPSDLPAERTSNGNPYNSPLHITVNHPVDWSAYRLLWFVLQICTVATTTLSAYTASMALHHYLVTSVMAQGPGVTANHETSYRQAMLGNQQTLLNLCRNLITSRDALMLRPLHEQARDEPAYQKLHACAERLIHAVQYIQREASEQPGQVSPVAARHLCKGDAWKAISHDAREMEKLGKTQRDQPHHTTFYHCFKIFGLHRGMAPHPGLEYYQAEPGNTESKPSGSS